MKRLVLLLIAAIAGITMWAAEPCAVYTSSNKTLTFYYDNVTHSGDVRPFPTSETSQPWWSSDTNVSGNVEKVVFDQSFRLYHHTSGYSWFQGMTNLTSIEGLQYFNTDQMVNMYCMFYKCSKLSSIDLSHFNTAKVTNMYGMFMECHALTNLNVSSFNTAKVTNMSMMFYKCDNLTSLNLSNFNTTNVTDMSNMFDQCRALTSLNVSSFNTSKVTKMRCMFYSCNKLSSLNLSNFNTANVTDMSEMFSYCESLTSLNVTSFNTSKVTDMRHMFDSCEKLTSLDVTGFNTANVTIMGGLFMNCYELTTIDFGNFNTAKVTDMFLMFYSCPKLKVLDLSSFNTSKVTSTKWMFDGCSELTTIVVDDGWDMSNVTNSVEMFNGCRKLVGGEGTTYNASHVDKTYAHIDGGPSNPGYLTEKLEAYACYTPSNKTLTFYCDKQRASRTGTTYDLNTDYNRPGWRSDGIYDYVHKVEFASSFTKARPTSTYYWFGGMTHLESITGINYLNTSEVTEMRYMFDDCSQLNSLDVSGFNTAKVTKMGYMFRNCSALTSLNVSNFNTAQATDLRGMFSGNSALTNIDLSNFNTANVTNMSYMFYGCSNLKTIYAGNAWSTAAVTSSDNMFSNCTKLVGGKGTTYNANHVDAAYAHIDGGTSNPGYLTGKNVVENYDLWICGKRVTSSNMNGVTGTGISGTVTYNPDTHTLTLNNATLYITNQSVNAISTVYGAPANLKINLVGTNKILSNSQQIAIDVYESQGFTICGSGTLNCGGVLYLDARNSMTNNATMSYIKDCSVIIYEIISNDYEECLTIDNADVTTEYLLAGSDHNNYQGLKLINCYVAKPEGGYVKNGCIYVGNNMWNDHVEIKRGSAPGILGDIDGSGIVDVEDVNAAINIILKLKTMADYPGNGDMDNNGMIDVEDVNAMINIILHLN